MPISLLLASRLRKVGWLKKNLVVVVVVVAAAAATATTVIRDAVTLGPDYKKILRFLLRLSQVRSQVYRKFSTIV